MSDDNPTQALQLDEAIASLRDWLLWLFPIRKIAFCVIRPCGMAEGSPMAGTKILPCIVQMLPGGSRTSQGKESVTFRIFS